jgi:hypothetical protein
LQIGNILDKLKSIKELLRVDGKRLSTLKARTADRSLALQAVRAALSPELAQATVSAGFEHGRLTIGVNGGAYATRLRYATDDLRLRVGAALGADIQSVRIRVVPSPP